MRVGVELLERGSNPLPTVGTPPGSLGSPTTGFGAELRPPKGFPLFSALRMASSDTIILLIVDYRTAIGGGGQAPSAPRLRTPLT